MDPTSDVCFGHMQDLFTEWLSRARLHEITAVVVLARNERRRPESCGKERNGAFFRLVKCTTNRPPWQAATGGTRHGQRYQEAGRYA